MTMSMKNDISNVAKDVELKKTWKEIHEKNYNIGKKNTWNAKGITQ